MDVRRDAKKNWEEAYRKSPERDAEFSTMSGIPVKPLYTEEDLSGDLEEKLGYPGEFPYTRGVYPTMYRGRLWTVRQFAGYGDAKDTNERFKYLIENGQQGLSVAFDMPTLMGLDSDSPLSLGEVGTEGVAVDSLEDMERLFDGIAMDEITTSMTINAPAMVLLAMYVVAAEKKGIPPEKLGGTNQNDILKEYIAQKEWLFPPAPSMRVFRDMLVYATEHLPKWNTVSISGYHIREAGSTAAQELAFTLSDGFAYVEAGIEAGLDVDDFAPRFSFFFNSHIDFFEEIAKFRAARRIWATVMRDKYGAKDERSLRMRFHTQTAGVSLTAQEPYNNIARTAFEALAAVLGGTQSLHTNSFDEALALPTEEAVRVAVRTQQIAALETGVTNTIDPLGGSYFVEALTDEIERQAYEYFDRIDELGGVIPAIEQGFQMQEIAEASARYQRELEEGRRYMVNVNVFEPKDEQEIELHRVDHTVSERQIERVKKLKKERDNEKVKETLAELRRACETDKNTMYPIIECVKAYATVQEICDTMKEVFGSYRETPVI
ncbi:methylmalonyl-CoA mutase N-terminal domain [Rubrobacter radiotolerans]|uniref:Methylmalonyl-CoA mutase N-terminal domain n=1 Tax=Rubrobacter radiotolerans TaxID=42256 RepID=A0A023X122_RUBRA|nr:methylmalonyl-CoA mutase family protein [Rubrobacter radiotolerans]AHY45710.1 methylmalonyl-CoA mutase N-terminal domain [Rubrobacter radiotolerans]MDX5893126.1 methylmalonyl-CoA mutase family protein [Rubrobacter radiotolerans]SMC03102.1 methylmalonyl-CoA mutase, N-terminal domain [Rubrobacter radiotolerans DSM 5868]